MHYDSAYLLEKRTITVQNKLVIQKKNTYSLLLDKQRSIDA